MPTERRTSIRGDVGADRPLDAAALIDALPHIVWTADADGSADFFNAAWTTFTGLSRAESTALGWLSAFHDADERDAFARWERSMATGEHFEGCYRLRAHDGAYRTMNARAAAVRNDSGAIVKWVGTFVDVHDTVEARSGEQRAEARYRNLLERLPANIWTARPDGSNDFVSPAWTLLSGWASEAALGDAWTTFVHPDDRERMQQSWQRSVRTGEPYAVVFRFFNRRAGYYEWALSKAVAMRDGGGAIAAWFGVITDMQRRLSNTAAFAFLASAGAASAQFTGDWALQAILAAAIPDYADAGVVARSTRDGAWREPATAGDPLISGELRALFDRQRADGVVERVIRRGAPMLVESPAGTRRSLITAAFGEPASPGVIVLGRVASRPPFEPEDLDVMSEVAVRAGEVVRP